MKTKMKLPKSLIEKKTSTIILGSVAQGIKYVVEFSFMLSFGFATIIMFFYSADLFVAFVATFAYAEFVCYHHLLQLYHSFNLEAQLIKPLEN